MLPLICLPTSTPGNGDALPGAAGSVKLRRGNPSRLTDVVAHARAVLAKSSTLEELQLVKSELKSLSLLDQIFENDVISALSDALDARILQLQISATGSRRGPLPESPAQKTTIRVVGRSSELSNDQTELHYFLVYFPASKAGSKKTRKARYEWKRMDEMTTQEGLMAALEHLPEWLRGADPDNDGWVVLIDDYAVDGSKKLFRTTWFTWGPTIPLNKKQEWRHYSDFVNKDLADAYEANIRAEAGLKEVDSADEADGGDAVMTPDFLDDTQESSQVTGGDPTADAPSSLRWDPARGTPRLSLRAAVRNHGGGEDWTFPMLKSYTLTRMYVLRSRVPPAQGMAGEPTAAAAAVGCGAAPFSVGR